MLKRLSSAAMILAAAQMVVALGMLVASNPEGILGGVLFALMYAAPLLLLALALGSAQPGLRTAAGWAALGLSLAYSAVVVGNWSGYSDGQAVIAVTITVPTVVLDLVIFWSAAASSWVKRRPTPAR